MGLRRMLVRMLDPEGNSDGSKIIGISDGKASWVDASSSGGGTSVGGPFPTFGGNIVKSLINNEVSYPASGSAVTLHTVTGAGIVTSYQVTHSAKAMAEAGRMQFFVDGESTPSVDVEVGTLFGIHDDAFPTDGALVTNEHSVVSFTSSSTYADTSSETLLLPIPFSDGLIVKFYNPSVATPAGDYSSVMFSALQYQEGDVAGVTDRYRLKSVSTPFQDPLDGSSGAALPLFAKSAVAGWLVYFSALVAGDSDYSFLERPWNVNVDGESTPAYRGNSEDWWNSGFYLGGLERFSSRVASVTAANNDNHTFAGAIDLLEMVRGGIPFTTDLAMTYGASAEIKSHNYETTDFTIGFAALYYLDLSNLPAATVPDAPTGVTATAGDVQATITYTAPVNDGGSAITSYTATSSPGGFTGTSASPGDPITVTGLTNGTAYTFTVVATNAVGDSDPSSASSAVTPAAAPTADISDDFNRADSSSLGTTPVGGKTWSVENPGTSPFVGISSNKALVRPGAAGNQPFAIIDTGVADYDVSVTVTLGATPQYAQIDIRWVDANNYVLVQADASTSPVTRYAMYRKNAGSYTLMVASTGVTPNDGDVLRVTASGSTYEFFVNGVSQGTATNAVNSTTATKVGFSAGLAAGSGQNTATFDDFSVTFL